jgi:hypothetical protein
MSAMGQVEIHVGDLCRELGVTARPFIGTSGLMGSSVGTAKNCLTELAVPLLPKPHLRVGEDVSHKLAQVPFDDQRVAGRGRAPHNSVTFSPRAAMRQISRSSRMTAGCSVRTFQPKSTAKYGKVSPPDGCLL